VITIQSVMLVALGFLVATLLALALAPAYWARAVRLTRRNILHTMPVTEEEIRADKDRLRAQYAVRIHDLESKLEKAKRTAARQQVEVNRRDATISALETELAQLRTDLEQNFNARRVLEQTVVHRLPAIEQRLADTRNLLEQRDRELAAVNAETGKTVRALDEVMQINAQQRAEIERLNAVVTTRAARNRGPLRDSQFDGEVALRSELEALRAKAREQETLITRLQALVSEPGSQAPPHSPPSQINGAEQGLSGEASELIRLRQDLAEAEQALRAVTSSAGAAGETGMDRLIAGLNTKIDEQAATIRKLEAVVAAYEQGEAGSRSISLKDSKIALKARIGALQTEVESQAVTIQKLRAEIAAANERLALQSTQFMEEMRRLGAGLSSPGQGRRPVGMPVRRSLAERIGEAKPALANAIKTITRLNTEEEPSPGSADGAGETKPAADGRVQAAAPHSTPHVADGPATAANPEQAAPASGRQASENEVKPRLLDRIAGLGKS
jgi:hypothetical protein